MTTWVPHEPPHITLCLSSADRTWFKNMECLPIGASLGQGYKKMGHQSTWGKGRVCYCIFVESYNCLNMEEAACYLALKHSVSVLSEKEFMKRMTE